MASIYYLKLWNMRNRPLHPAPAPGYPYYLHRAVEVYQITNGSEKSKTAERSPFFEITIGFYVKNRP